VALDEIYKEVILDHYKNPRNKREIADAELTCSKNTCLRGRIIAFVRGGRKPRRRLGRAARSAAGLDDDRGRGASRESRGADRRIRGMMAGEVEPDEEAFGELVALKGVVKYPVRIKCAVLPWDVLQEALGGTGEAAGSAPH
jgi:nitrogen fixation NifU-like protein